MRLAVYLFMIAVTFYFAGMFRYEPLLMVGLVEMLLMAAMFPLPFFVRRKLMTNRSSMQLHTNIFSSSLRKEISNAAQNEEMQQHYSETSVIYITKGNESMIHVTVTNRGKLPGGTVRIHIDTGYASQNVFRDRSKRITKYKPISKNNPASKNSPASKYKLTSKNKPASKNSPISKNSPTSKYKPTSKYMPASKYMSTSKYKWKIKKMIGTSNPGDNPLVAQVTFPYCGLVTVHMKSTYVYDYFSIFRAKLPYREQISYAVLPGLPGMQFLMPSSMQQESGDGMNTYPEKIDWGYDILQVRDFQPGEGERQVHWKLSARSDKVIVKEYERKDNLKAYLFLEQAAFDRAGIAGKSVFYEVVYALILGLTERELAVKMFYFDGAKHAYEHTEIRNLTELQEAILLLYQLDTQPMRLSLGLPTPPWRDENNGDFECAYRFRVNENLQLFYRNELLWRFDENTVEQDVMEQIFTL
jgi:hypothetical protein